MNENCYLCKKTLTDADSYHVGSVWSCEKCLDRVIQLVNENRIKNKSFRPIDTWTSKSIKLGKGEVWEFVK